jgi:hypothetical protein
MIADLLVFPDEGSVNPSGEHPPVYDGFLTGNIRRSGAAKKDAVISRLHMIWGA